MKRRWTEEDLKNLPRKAAILPPAKVSTAKEKMQALGRLRLGEMNKTERLYSKYLEQQKFDGEILWWEFEPVNLRLGKKCFYSVDFMVMKADGTLEAHETKGYMTDDAKVKIRTAVEKFPWPFIVVKLVKGNWEFTKY